MKRFIPALILLLLPLHTFAAWDWIGGAELNSVTDGVEVTTNSAPIATTTTAHSGSFAWEVKNGAGFQRQVILTTNNIATAGIIRAWIFVKAYPNAATQLLRFSNATNVSAGNITMNTNGTLVLLKVNGTQTGSASSAVPLNTWTYVELELNGTNFQEARLNGSVFATGANSSGFNGWARALWGNITGTQTSNDIIFDDVAVTDGATGYPGGTSEAFIQPSGDGDSHQWLQTGGGAGSATNYTLVSETPPDDATSFVNTGTANNADLYLMGAGGTHSYDTINALTISARYANNTADAATAFKLEYETTSGGSKALSAALVPNSLVWTSYGVQAAKADSANFATTTGATGAALTSADLASGQMGYILSTAGTNRIEVTNLWAYADYTPGTPPATGGDLGQVILFGDW